jgi:hypothetical protein
MPRSQKPTKRIRVRSKSLAEIDETKLSLAMWLMAKRLLEEQEDEAPPEEAAP